MQPQFFTRYGAFMFVLSQVLKGLTAAVVLLFLWDKIPLVEFGWIAGNERSSVLLPTALMFMLLTSVSVQGSVARPAGPGTGKWYFNDAVWSIAIAVVLFLGTFGALATKGSDVLTGLKLDVAIMTSFLFALQVWIWVSEKFLDTNPVTATPRVPAPTIVRFTANPMSVAAGGTVVLDWAANYAVEAEISGIGIVPVNGPLSVRPVGAVAGNTVTYTLTVRGPGGNATASVTVTLS